MSKSIIDIIENILTTSDRPLLTREIKKMTEEPAMVKKLKRTLGIKEITTTQISSALKGLDRKAGFNITKTGEANEGYYWSLQIDPCVAFRCRKTKVAVKARKAKVISKPVDAVSMLFSGSVAAGIKNYNRTVTAMK